MRRTVWLAERLAGAVVVLFLFWVTAARGADCRTAQFDGMPLPVAIALGKASLASCPQIDTDGNGAVTLAEVMQSVSPNAAANGLAPRAAGTVTLDVGTATGPAGAQVTFPVTLDTGGLQVSGTQNDIAFDALTPIASLSGDPDCSVNPGINKSIFTAFQPIACTPGVDCTGMRAIVISLSNVDAIPDGGLYTCNVDIDSLATPAVYPLVGSGEASSSPSADPLPTVGDDGAIIVAGGLDHYKCYKAKDLKAPKFQATTLALSDQFGSAAAEVKKPFLLCTPVDKNSEGIANLVDHLACYKIKTSNSPAVNVQVSNQLGNLRLRTGKASLLCVPSTKSVLP